MSDLVTELRECYRFENVGMPGPHWGILLAAADRIEELESLNAALRAACEQKQEIIDSFQAVDDARMQENWKLKQELSAGVVVPREPTEEMIDAGREALERHGGGIWTRHIVVDIYKAMLKAVEKNSE